jgi:hypothetical protein
MYENQISVPVNYLHCIVCKKTYNKLGSHSSCYKKYCWICKIIFKTDLEQQIHSKIDHTNNYCNICKENISNIIAHRKNKKYCIN